MRSKALHEFKLHRQEKFLYICDTLDMWEWDVRVLDIQDGVEGDYAPICVGGRGAAPPEFCGGPTGYRLMLKRQREGAAMSDPVRLEAVGTGVGRTASTRWSNHGGYRRRLRSRGAQAGMVRSDRGQKRRRFSPRG